jgi:hypothetical protein
MRRRFTRMLVALLMLSGMATQAAAHFLFIRIGEPDATGRRVEVFFSEHAQAGDPAFVEKIAHTKLWVQKTPGEFTALEVHKAADRLTAQLPDGQAVSVIGQCEYGVLVRDVPFLLRYYPKAVTGAPEAVNALKPRDKIPLEIVARFSEQGVTLTALRHGKPVPGAVFTTIDDDLVNEELKADADGHATWKSKTAGYYCVYTRAVTKQAGKSGEKSYDEIREFATLAFPWPLKSP